MYSTYPTRTMHSHIAELFIAKDDGRSTIKLFIASPTPLEEKNLGTVFAILEIDSQEQINDEILNVIIDEINTQYYQSETFSVESAFEHALQKTNHRLQELIGEIGEEWLTDLNVIIGVVKDGELIFTNLGRVIALMVYGNTIVDILDSTKSKSADINPVKVFSNILTGELNDQSTLFFATESILDYLSKEKIKRLVKEKNSTDAMDELHSILIDDTTNTNFAGVILEKQEEVVEVQKEPITISSVSPSSAFSGAAQPVRADSTHSSISPTTPIPVNVDDDSMEQLMGKQYRTQELLTSSIWPSLKKNVQDTMKRLVGRPEASERRFPVSDDDQLFADDSDEPKYTEDEASHTTGSEQGVGGRTESVGMRTQSSVTRSSAARASGFGPKALAVAKTIGLGLWRGIKQLAQLIAQGVQTLMKKRSEQSSSSRNRHSGSSRRGKYSVSQAATSGISRVLKWFGSLTALQKGFFLVAVIVLFIFAQSVVNKGETNISKEEQDQYTTQIAEIDKKINEGKAAILYNSESARGTLLDARNMLNQIPKDSDIYAERGAELEAAIDAQLKRLNNVITLENPTPMIDYGSINGQIQVNHMMLLGASMYAFDANTNSVYRGNLENGEENVTISDSSNTFVVAATKASPGTGVVKMSDESFATFNPVAEQFESLDLKYPEGKHGIVDLLLFGSRLYTLDPKTNQIYRHLSDDSGFQPGGEWLSADGIDLSTAVSFAVDGSIYVLGSDGTVRKFSAGAADELTLAAIDPALNSAKKIYTDENSDKLYILDAANKRVVVFTKEGALFNQYTSNSFGDLKDMVVDEANKKMYVLNGAQVFEIGLQETAATPAEGQ